MIEGMDFDAMLAKQSTQVPHVPDLSKAAKEAPTYKEMLAEASKHDPQYVKYANRRNPWEPDDMTVAIRKTPKMKGRWVNGN